MLVKRVMVLEKVVNKMFDLLGEDFTVVYARAQDDVVDGQRY
jgi:hypothetical protein